MTEQPTVPAAQPAVDVVTERVGVVLQDRPVVSLSSWLADALRTLTDAGRGLQLVTPATSRLTLAVRLHLLHPDSRWVIRDENGYHDGLGGTVLAWDGARFAPVLDEEGQLVLAPSWRAGATGLGRQLVVNARFRHDAAATTVVGGPTSAIAEELTGVAPAGWGTAEPAGRPWREADLTVFARNRAPAPTWLAVVGPADARPLVGSLEIHRVPSGLDEEITLAVGYDAGEPLPVDDVAGVVDRLAGRYELVSFLVQTVDGPRDLTSVPAWCGLPAPVGFAVGHEAVAGVGLAAALAPPAGRALGVGPAGAPGVHYALGDGVDPEGWIRYAALLQHLGVPGMDGGPDRTDPAPPPSYEQEGRP